MALRVRADKGRRKGRTTHAHGTAAAARPAAAAATAAAARSASTASRSAGMYRGILQPAGAAEPLVAAAAL